MLVYMLMSIRHCPLRDVSIAQIYGPTTNIQVPIMFLSDIEIV